MGQFECNGLEFYPSTPHILSLTSIFLEGKSIRNIKFQLDSDRSWEYMLEILKQFSCENVQVQLNDKIPAAYLCDLAKIVDSI
ncbi:hypothetical protein PMAYCL1PPCAC_28354, partial [Pristionchus mayeri]